MTSVHSVSIHEGYCPVTSELYFAYIVISRVDIQSMGKRPSWNLGLSVWQGELENEFRFKLRIAYEITERLGHVQ